MAKLSINMAGFVFQEGVAHLRTSFGAASAALNGQVAAARDAVSAYVASVEAGGEWIGERDEDGETLWDQEQVLEFEVVALESAAMALRKALAIAIYHHWERMARIWTGAHPDHGHRELSQKSQSLGYPIDPRLEGVRCLVNLLKHDRITWAQKLHVLWPEIMPAPPAAGRRAGWSETVRLREEHIWQILEVVSASGPTADSV